MFGSTTYCRSLTQAVCVFVYMRWLCMLGVNALMEYRSESEIKETMKNISIAYVVTRRNLF